MCECSTCKLRHDAMSQSAQFFGSKLFVTHLEPSKGMIGKQQNVEKHVINQRMEWGSPFSDKAIGRLLADGFGVNN